MSGHIHTHGRPYENGPVMQCPRCTPLQARIAELERQRDEVLALLQITEDREIPATCWVIANEIRAIYRGGQ